MIQLLHLAFNAGVNHEAMDLDLDLNLMPGLKFLSLLPNFAFFLGGS